MGLFKHDIDALHILPLSIIPLTTAGLRKARIVKNSQLKGMIELFADDNAGSGQISPDALPDFFQFAEGSNDPAIVAQLCDEPSYDVYSLRKHLRETGIQLNEGNCLKLSKDAEALLLPKMRTLIRPLIDRVYGGDAKQADLKDIFALFTDPDRGQARKNLTDLAAQMGMDLPALPAFLEAYGDVYLSLAYHQFNLDEMRPRLTAFLKVMGGLRRQASSPGGSGSYLRACASVARKLKLAHTQTHNILDVLRVQTEAMWENISPERFNETRELICSHQNDIGAALCAIAVKLEAWSHRFPKETSGEPEDRMHFVVSEMLPGMEAIRTIVSAPAIAKDEREVFFID